MSKLSLQKFFLRKLRNMPRQSGVHPIPKKGTSLRGFRSTLLEEKKPKKPWRSFTNLVISTATRKLLRLMSP
ncbi:hypothetical protein HYU14_06300 [Candidatus Woesearchaeota archaeon]|nr:hypothetical protein [Candidatus Woesearchaeota archaeon]